VISNPSDRANPARSLTVTVRFGWRNSAVGSIPATGSWKFKHSPRSSVVAKVNPRSDNPRCAGPATRHVRYGPVTSTPHVVDRCRQRPGPEANRQRAVTHLRPRRALVDPEQSTPAGDVRRELEFESLGGHVHRCTQRQTRSVVWSSDRRTNIVATMVSIDHVAQIALELPEATEGERYGTRAWSVGRKAFVWERSFSKADVKRFGDESPPSGIILAARVDDLGEKDAVIAANPISFFTIPHFDGHAEVLIQLDKVGKRALRETIVDAWLAVAPASLVRAYTARR
jgi:hypothetical protein